MSLPARKKSSGRVLATGLCSSVDDNQPKYSVAQVFGFLKGKSAITIASVYLGQRKNYNGMHFWARRYFVSTVGSTKISFGTKSKDKKKKIDELSSCRSSKQTKAGDHLMVVI